MESVIIEVSVIFIGGRGVAKINFVADPRISKILLLTGGGVGCCILGTLR